RQGLPRPSAVPPRGRALGVGGRPAPAGLGGPGPHGPPGRGPGHRRGGPRARLPARRAATGRATPGRASRRGVHGKDRLGRAPAGGLVRGRRRGRRAGRRGGPRGPGRLPRGPAPARPGPRPRARYIMKRPSQGRALFYTRDSLGRHETTPTEYVRWARREAERLGLRFDGTPERIEAMIREGRSVDGDLYLDYRVTGNGLSRPGLAALFRAAADDPTVSHVLIPTRDRLARPDDPLDGMTLETRLRRDLGLALVLRERTAPAQKRGRRRDMAEMLAEALDYGMAGKF